MGKSKQEMIGQAFVRGFLTCGLFLCFYLGQTVSAAEPADSAPSTSPPPSSSRTPPQEDVPGESRGKMREGMQKFRQACDADVKQFCPNGKPGGGRILQCLDEHSKEVSGNCQSMLEKRGQRRQK